MVAIRPADSCKIESSSAAVGDAEESPTPMPDRTALDESKPAMELEKAWSESCPQDNQTQL